jgi:hypothetical protein
VPPGGWVHLRKGPNMPQAAQGGNEVEVGSAAGAEQAQSDAGPHGTGFMAATVWLMCDDVEATVGMLHERGVDCQSRRTGAGASRRASPTLRRTPRQPITRRPTGCSGGAGSELVPRRETAAMHGLTASSLPR